jgi:hypothetical protein
LRADDQGNAFWSNPLELNDNDWLASGNNIYRPSGDVGIGTSETFGYRLAVNGSIISEEVTVKVREDWPDYVFEDDYKLISLNDLNIFVQKNGHLPEVPSAESLQDTGLELGSMQRILLKKIEELTLYIIQQDRKISELESQFCAQTSH